MGSENRDYMQDDYESRGSSSWGVDVPTTKWLLIATVVVFFLQTLMVHGPEIGFGGGGGLKPSYVEEWFGLNADKALNGQVWRLITYVFLHQRHNPFGIVFNMLILYYFGSQLERMYGSRELFWFYMTSALITGLIFTGFSLWVDLPEPLMGAGTSVAALFTLYATHFPRQEILIFWLVPVQIWLMVTLYALVEIYQIAQAYSGQHPWAIVAYTSELWGIAFGYLYRRLDLHLQGFVEFFNVGSLRRSMRRMTAGRKLKVYEPEQSSNFEEQVDAILDKIHKNGSESLTERERYILQKASEKAKNRQ